MQDGKWRQPLNVDIIYLIVNFQGLPPIESDPIGFCNESLKPTLINAGLISAKVCGR